MAEMTINPKVEPVKIAEEFVIQELIKLFPDEEQDFYDHVRTHIRNYRKNYSEEKFWRLVTGFSDYIVKQHYRFLKGNMYEWTLEEIPIKDLYLKKLETVEVLGDILKKVDFNAQKAGEILREYPPEVRTKIIDPFKFSKDNYPILVREQNGRLEVDDGNRRTINGAVYGMDNIQAYVGRLKNPPGKPAVPETFFKHFYPIFKDMKKFDDKFVESVANILSAFKTSYSNGTQSVNDFIKDHLAEDLKNEDQKKTIRKVLDLKA